MSESPFTTEQATLVNGEHFSIPTGAIPEIKDILVNVKNQQVREDGKQDPDWDRFGHRVSNEIASLMSSAYMGDSSEAQKEKLQSVTKKIIELKGEEVVPLLVRMGFPAETSKLKGV